jgi:hypothetical protein
MEVYELILHSWQNSLPGYLGRILYVDLSTGQSTVEVLESDFYTGICEIGKGPKSLEEVGMELARTKKELVEASNNQQ